MSNFRNFGKIYAIGKDETDGILDDECVLQEKVDGANTSIWIEDGELRFGSRTRDITVVESQFGSFIKYIKDNNSIKEFLLNNVNFILYGEWLSKHTIQYNENAYGKFYLFDIYDRDTGLFLPQSDVEIASKDLSLNYPQIFKQGKITMEDIKEFAGKTNLGKIGEGVVIKNINFVNRFGNKVYAKYVIDEFKENNSIIFGNNNKSSESYNEQKVVNKYISESRVIKIVNKLQSLLDRKLELCDTSRVCDTVYNDMLVEEIWSIQKDVSKIDFHTLKRLVYKKVALLFKSL